MPPPPNFKKPDQLLRTDPRFRGGRLRVVAPYGLQELQAALEFYALTGHIANPLLEQQLRTGDLAAKMSLLTAGVAEDVFKLASQL